jgi:arylsulfatase A
MDRRDRRERPLTLAAGLGLLVLAISPAWSAAARAEQVLAERPNIVYILADDLGYGDLRCLNPDAKIATPHLDRLAAQGMVFSDAHSGSAVCTPTRYGILTGRYAWRTRLQSGVLNGYSRPLIAPGRLTVAALLKQHGYRTAGSGKWHLGLDWASSDQAVPDDGSDTKAKVPQVDYTKAIGHGPRALGFDEFFGISASLDMPPYLYIHNDRTDGVPTTEKTYIRKGPAHRDFDATNVLPDLTRKAVETIDAQGRDPAKSKPPLFLYFPMTAPHTPIVPEAAFAGRSGIGPYGDFVMQVDAAVGQVLAALDRNGLAGSTLVFFTSDNGCSPAADFPALAAHGHNPSGRFRGTKADIFEGGHRIPFLARWPGKIKAGSACGDTICLTDLMATVAAILGANLPEGAGEDSVNLLPDLLGTASGPLREATVHHSINGSFAIRQGPWKLALCPGSGGWSAPRPGRDSTADLPAIQLYDLGRDIGETRNVQAEHPEIVERLTRLLDRYVADGRSTPGSPRANDIPVQTRKAPGT